MQKSIHRHAGFTLIEIMIVVAIIALLAAIAVPGFLRARKRSQATRILEDLRLLDAAIDQYALSTNQLAGTHPVLNDLRPYLKPGSLLYNRGRNVLNHRYGPFTVDQVPKVPPQSFNALSDVADADFWSPYN